jgi:hypothetical protein
MQRIIADVIPDEVAALRVEGKQMVSGLYAGSLHKERKEKQSLDFALSGEDVIDFVKLLAKNSLCCPLGSPVGWMKDRIIPTVEIAKCLQYWSESKPPHSTRNNQSLARNCTRTKRMNLFARSFNDRSVSTLRT